MDNSMSDLEFKKERTKNKCAYCGKEPKLLFQCKWLCKECKENNYTARKEVQE